MPALRVALADWMIDDKPADSILEKAMDKLVARFKLPRVEFHAIVEGYEVDFLVVGTPMLLECDGWGTHGRERAQFERDRARDAELTSVGYITVRFTYRKLKEDPMWVANKIRTTHDRWLRHGAPAPTGRESLRQLRKIPPRTGSGKNPAQILG